MPAAAATRSDLLKSRLERLSRSIAGIERGDGKSLHQARVAARRLRELVPMLQLNGPAARRLDRRLRKIGRRLGTLRELDVLVRLIDKLHAARPAQQLALRRVRSSVVKEREAARRRLPEHLSGDTVRRVVRKLERALEDWQEADRAPGGRKGRARDRALGWAVDARVAKRSAALQEALREAGAVYLPERLHVVRLAVKKLRYSVELRGDARRENYGAALRALKRTQTVLGEMHDLQTLIDRARETQVSLTPSSVAGWRDLDALIMVLDDGCRRMHGRFLHDRGAVQAIAERFAAAAESSEGERRAG